MPGSAWASGCVPGADVRTDGSASHGAAAVTLANFDGELAERQVLGAARAISPKAAISQNAVVPPLPSTTR